MGLTDITTIDMTFVDTEGRFVLVVTDHGLVTGQERDVAFRAKIAAYESYLNGQFSEDYPNKVASETYVQLVYTVEPSEDMNTIIANGISRNDGTKCEIRVEHLPSRY